MRRSAIARAIRDAADQIPADELLRFDSLSSVEAGANGAHYDDRDRVEAARLRIVDLACHIAPDETGRVNPAAADLFGRRDSRGRLIVDAQELLLFARELEHVMAEVEREEFADLRMANGEILPVNTSVPEGARTYTYYMLGSVGVAKFLAGYADDNLPSVDVRRVRLTGQIHPYGTSYHWTTADVRESQFGGFPLETELGIAARRAVDQLINDSGLFGRPELGLPGLLTHPNINHTPAPLNAGLTSTTWDDKTPDEIIRDVNTLITTVDEVTFGKEKVNTVLLARAAWNHINSRRLSTQDATMTILEYLERIWSRPQNGRQPIAFEVLDELTAVNSQGTFATDAAFAYTRGNRRKAELIVPMMFKQHAVQQHGLKFVVPVEGTTGGVRMPYPLMCNVMVGVY